MTETLIENGHLPMKEKKNLEDDVLDELQRYGISSIECKRYVIQSCLSAQNLRVAMIYQSYIDIQKKLTNYLLI